MWVDLRQEQTQTGISIRLLNYLGFPGSSDGKNLRAMLETWVQSLGWEDPLEEGMAAHSSILAWRIPVDKGAWQAAVHGVAKSQT